MRGSVVVDAKSLVGVLARQEPRHQVIDKDDDDEHRCKENSGVILEEGDLASLVSDGIQQARRPFQHESEVLLLPEPPGGFELRSLPLDPGAIVLSLGARSEEHTSELQSQA